MAAQSEWAKENKRRRTREWYAKAKAEGRLKTDGRQSRSRMNCNLTDIQIERRRQSQKRYDAKRGPTYITWRAMHKRCRYKGDDNYPNYGGRGITVCREWFCYHRFLSDMGERPEGKTLDRIDVNGIYEKSNCRWATPKEQANNRRTKAEVALAKSVYAKHQRRQNPTETH